MGELQKLFFCIVVSFVTKEVVPQCVTRNDYYVASYGNDSPDCREPNRTNTPCATLQYATHVNCSTVKILDDLTMDSSSEISDLHDVIITGYSSTSEDGSVILRCNHEISMSFREFVDLVWQNVHLRNCSGPVNPGSYTFTLWLNSCRNVLIQNCSFQSRYGYAILIYSLVYPYRLDFGTTTIKYCNFTGNQLVANENSRSGGIGVHIYFQSKLFLDIFNCRFVNNTIKMETECSLEFSSYRYGGGALNIEYQGYWEGGSNMTVTIQDSVFDSNIATYGGAISIFFREFFYLYLVDTQFIGNQAFCHGGAIMFFHHPADFNNTRENSFGLIASKTCKFESNSAYWGGGLAVFKESCEVCTASINIELTDSHWISNTANTSGLAVAVSGPKTTSNLDESKFNIHLNISGRSNFYGNYRSEDGTGAIAAENAFVVLNNDVEALFHENNGTAIVLKNCDMLFEGTASFSANSGTLGGAVLIDGNSVLSFGPTCNISFYDNHASSLGGAIYSGVSEYCTFDVDNMTDGSQVYFGPNFGGGLSHQSIYLESTSECSNIEKLLDHFDFENTSKIPVSLPIDSVGVEIIDTENEQLSSENIIKIKLGQIFYIQPTVKDELGQDAIGIAYITLESSYHHLVGPSKINLDSYTSSVEFSIRGQEVLQDTPVTLSVAYEKSGLLDISSFDIRFLVAPCAGTQKYSDVNRTCTCKVQAPYDYKKCSKLNQYLCLKRHYWLSDDYNTSYPCPALNCKYSVSESGCPLNESLPDSCDRSDFCIIDDLDDVCRDGRTGFLCSECMEDHAFTFEAFHCVSNTTCSTYNTVYLLLSLFAYWVVLLLAFVLVLSLNISVGSGFMFGIIYYFSVALIYTRSSAMFKLYYVQILMYFNSAIALLDLGLLGYWWKTCFKVDWKTPLPHELLRLATPLFLMVSVVIFVLVARCCRLPRRFSMSESSPIHAICLLILLSYTSVSYTSWKILVPFRTKDDAYRVQVAPALEYFNDDKNDFIPYFVVALLVQLFICLPVCFFFLFAPFLSKHVDLVKLRLKPIVDEFHACYKPECRWFAGFYFLARQVVYLICMIFTESYPQENSLLTTVNILVLITHTIAQPYSKKWLNMIDTILLTDIVILSLWSPEMAETGQWGKKEFHNYVIPYALILIPTIYLFAALFAIFFKKLVFNRCGQMCRRCQLNFTLPVILRKSTRKNDGFQLKSNTTATVVDPISNAEYREPLLEDLDTKMASSDSSSSHYGSM